MSGIYLVFFIPNDKDSSFLNTTKGGYPHITVAYTGNNLPVGELVKVSSTLLSRWALKEIECTKAYVNSFKDKYGCMRHDVLLELDSTTSNRVEDDRLFLKDAFPGQWEKFSFNSPHITNGIYSSLEDAQQRCDTLNKKELPRKLVVTGITID